MRIAIIGQMPNNSYSGGRYHAWVMAECLLNEGNEVIVITNNIPPFANDFVDYPYHSKIRIILTNTFKELYLVKDRIDWVIAIPSISINNNVYTIWKEFAYSKNASLAFVNFETPNWYSECGMITRNLTGYEKLRELCKYGALVFSSANESDKYAKEYYNKYPESTEFCVWSPAINTKVADSINVKKENQIMVFLRDSDKHKGSNDFLDVLDERLAGYTIVCVVGTSISSDYLVKIYEKAYSLGIRILVKQQLSDLQKFTEYKKSKVLLFPSHFEGYGYPPVEALYCGTRCVCYELPVLKEISGNHLTMCKMNDTRCLKDALCEEIVKPPLNQIIVDTAVFEKQAERLNQILEEYRNNTKIRNTNNLEEYICALKLRVRYGINRIDSIKNKLILCDFVKNEIDGKSVISTILKEDDESWHKIKPKLRNKKIFVWGYGGGYLSIFPKYSNRIRLSGIIDESKYKQGMQDTVTKHIIQSSEILRDYDPNMICVLISSAGYVDEIIERLKSLKIEEFHSLVMIEKNSLLGKKYAKKRKS